MSETHDLRNKQILVTGGQGFIGRHAVQALSRLGALPTSVVHPDRDEREESIGSVVLMDLENPVDVASAVGGCDLVVHLAARAGGIQFQEGGAEQVFSTNRLMTDNVLRATTSQGIGRLFLASSSVIYKTASRPIRESDPHLALSDAPSPYAWSKITDEVVSSWTKDIDTVIGRFGNVYGPGAPFDPNRSTVVHALIDRAAQLADYQDLVVWGDGSAIRSFIYVEDAAEAVARILTHGQPGEAYNVDGGEPVSIAELATVVRDEVNPTLRLVFDDSKPAGAPYRVGSIEKLSELGFSPNTSLSDGIAATVGWYRSHVARG